MTRGKLIPFTPPRGSLFVLAFSSFSGTPCRVVLHCISYVVSVFVAVP